MVRLAHGKTMGASSGCVTLALLLAFGAGPSADQPAAQAQAAGQVPAEAQLPPAGETPAGQGAPAASPADAGVLRQVLLTAGRSTVISSPFAITRIAITDPEIADAVVVEPREVLIDGKAPGTVSLILWGEGRRMQYDIVVDPGVTTLQQQLHALFPGENIEVSVSGTALILSGSVSSNDVSLRAAEIAAGSASESQIINMLQLPGGQSSQQVMLQVRMAEVNRRALRELGASMFAMRDSFLARSTTQQFAAPDFDDEGNVGGLVFSDFLNLFFFSRDEGIGTVIRALQSRGFFQSLAEPNLIAYNGKEASFLAGGEFPVPVVQGATGTVTVLFKEFGVRLNFLPTIAGDVIRLRVRPEVSTLDFANGITLSGFRIPALTTRRAETEVELRDGQSFAIAGLLDNLSQSDSSSVPFLSRIPIIGNLFKGTAERSEQTELMVLITPRLIRALNPDEVPPLPVDRDSFLPSSESLGSQLEGGVGPLDGPTIR